MHAAACLSIFSLIYYSEQFIYNTIIVIITWMGYVNDRKIKAQKHSKMLFTVPEVYCSVKLR